MENNFYFLHDDEVIRNPEHHFVAKTFTTNEALENIMNAQCRGHAKEKLLKEGLDVEVLRFGGRNWKKGRIKLSITFIPEESDKSEQEIVQTDQPESPLDDIRQMVLEEKSETSNEEN